MFDKGLSERYLRRLIHLPATYHILFPLLGLLHLKENRAYRIWVKFLLNTFREAYARKKPVVWINSFFPSEIIYGLGALPVLPEIISALVTYLGLSERFIFKADTRLSTDLCSFYRCTLGLVLENYLPRPDLILSSSHLCDGANKFFNYLSQIYQCPHFLLDPPYYDQSHSHRYMEEQIEELVRQSSSVLSLPLSKDRFSMVLDRSNQTRQWMVKINQLRESIPSPFPGSEGLSYLSGMSFYSMGSVWALHFFPALHKEIKKKVTLKRGYLPKEKHRLLWLHHVRPYYKNEIFNILSSKGVSISFEEANYLYWPPLDTSQPWNGLANKILSNIWAGPIERRIKAIEEMILTYSIDGVIHFSHWGCRQSSGGAAIIGDWLKQKGIPYLVLFGDCADPANYSPGQTRTRLEAFIEMMG